MADTQASTPQTNTARSFTTEVDPGAGYQRLSRLAVWSIPLGLMSALSMVSPLLWIVPVAAIVFAVGGLWVIAHSDDTTGRRLAITGLGLAILFGTWGMSWTISRRMVLTGQAREHASEWLELMQNEEYMKAHQLSLDYFGRLPAGTSLTEHYAETETPLEEADGEAMSVPDPGSDSAMGPLLAPEVQSSPSGELNAFMRSDLPRTLVAAQGKFEFRFVENVSVRREGQFATKIKQIFHLTFADNHEPREMDVQIEMKRTVDEKQAFWQLVRASAADAPS